MKHGFVNREGVHIVKSTTSYLERLFSSESIVSKGSVVQECLCAPLEVSSKALRMRGNVIEYMPVKEGGIQRRSCFIYY